MTLSLVSSSAEAYLDHGNMLKENGKPQEAVASYQQALALKPDYAKAYINLGVVYQEEGLLEEAAVNYRRALAIKSDYVAAHFNLGALHMSLGQTEDALRSFRKAITLKPDLTPATHMIAVLEGKTTQSAPHDYIKNLFNHYANNFENHLLHKLEYTIPQVIFEKFTLLTATNWRQVSHALDLGCGTGLNGEQFRKIADRLSGVDLSDKMLRIALNKNIYNNLHLSDLTTFLNESNELYDLFLASDVFVYVGDLEMVFEAIKNHSLPGAYFAFSTEWIDEGEFILQKSARYAHSRDYIKSLCNRFGFRVALCDAVKLRKDQGVWVRGDIFILQLDANWH
ncbi:MAG: tetratricopeptide repeat protein [Desulfurivibrionaceae bacterium]|jgi:predicted TPR repeat methyltransferase